MTVTPRTLERRAALVEDVEWLLDSDETPSTIAARYGIASASVARALYRAGRPDLARRFENADIRRCATCPNHCTARATRCRQCNARYVATIRKAVA